MEQIEERKKEFFDGKEFLDQYTFDNASVFDKKHPMYPVMVKLLDEYREHIAKEAGFFGGFASRTSTKLRKAISLLRKGSKSIKPVLTGVNFALDSELVAVDEWNRETQDFIAKHSVYVD